MKKLSILAIFVVLAIYGGWEWFFCRFYVPPGNVAVVTAKSGDSLPAGEMLAKPGQKGVWAEPLSEGRHFLNPFNYSINIIPRKIIPNGKVGLVTAKTGTDLKPGEFLANPGQKGVLKGVIGPGSYSINPYAFDVSEIDALSIPVGYVGIITSLSGKPVEASQFAKIGQSGVMGEVLQPGLYYINPKEYDVKVIEVGLNQVSLLGKEGAAVIAKSNITTQNKAVDELQIKVLQSQKEVRESSLGSFADSNNYSGARPAMAEKTKRAPSAPAAQVAATAVFVLNQHISFPSRDGFDILLDMTVEFEFLPEHLPYIFREYGDMPQVVDKIIMPQVLSVSRMKGSAYRAVDFIVGEGREKFQEDITKSLATAMADKKILVHSALIRHVNVPDEILVPLKQAAVATEQDLTNQEKAITADALAALNTEIGMVTQKASEIAQGTEKMKAEVKAETEKVKAEVAASTLKLVAEIDQKTSATKAQRDVVIGKATAQALTLTEGEIAKGYVMKIKAFGDAKSYNLAEFAKNLDFKNIKIIHAGQGTLWTDLEGMSAGTAALLNQNATKNEIKPDLNKKK